MYKCILIDDDAFSLDNLANMLEEHPDFKINKKIKDSNLATKYIYTLDPDIVFLDIDMPDKNGIEILNEINELDVSTYVVFITAYNEYVVDAFRKKAFDYLLKPIKKHELDESLFRFKQEKSQKNKTKVETVHGSNRISFRNTHGTTIMKTQDILYIKADGCYTKIFDLNERPEIISKNIGKIEQEFPDTTFFKISRSIIINMNYISKIDRMQKQITLSVDGTTIDLKASRNRLYDLETKIKNLK